MSPDTNSSGSTSPESESQASAVAVEQAVEQSGNNAKLLEATKYQVTNVPDSFKDKLGQLIGSAARDFSGDRDGYFNGIKANDSAHFDLRYIDNYLPRGSLVS